MVMNELREIYMSYNNIEELFDFGTLEKLEVLDLEGNDIKDG